MEKLILCFLLLVPTPVMLHSLHTAKVLTEADLEKLVFQVVQEFEGRKETRNNITNEQVAVVIQEIHQIIPALTELHQGAHDILQKGLPGYAKNARKQMEVIQANIENTLWSLDSAIPCEGYLKFTVGLPTEATSSSDEDVSQWSSEDVDTSDSDSPVDESLTVPKKTAVDHEGDHAGHELSGKDSSGQYSELYTDLMTPITYGEAKMKAVLANYEEDTHVAIKDVIQMFMNVASRLEMEHIGRFTAILDTIKDARATTLQIRDHIIHVKDEIDNIGKRSNGLFQSFNTRAIKLREFAKQANSEASSLVCME